MKLTFNETFQLLKVVYLVGGTITGYHLSGWIFTFSALGIIFSSVLYVVAILAFFVIAIGAIPGDPPTADPGLALFSALPFLSFGLILGYLGATAGLIFF